MNLGEMDENGQLRIWENVKQLYDIWEDIKEDDMRENSQTDKDMTVICKKCKYSITCNISIIHKIIIYLKIMTIGRKLDILQDTVISFI